MQRTANLLTVTRSNLFWWNLRKWRRSRDRIRWWQYSVKHNDSNAIQYVSAYSNKINNWAYLTSNRVTSTSCKSFVCHRCLCLINTVHRVFLFRNHLVDIETLPEKFNLTRKRQVILLFCWKALERNHLIGIIKCLN